MAGAVIVVFSASYDSMMLNSQVSQSTLGIERNRVLMKCVDIPVVRVNIDVLFVHNFSVHSVVSSETDLDQS